METHTCVGFQFTIPKSKKKSVTYISVCPLLGHSICAHLTCHVSYNFCSFNVNINSKESDIYVIVAATVHFFMSVFCKITSLCGK